MRWIQITHSIAGRPFFCTANHKTKRGSPVAPARNKHRQKRGGDRQPVDLDAIDVALSTPSDDLLALDEALGQLAAKYSECAELVKLRFFAGMSQGEAANMLGIPRRTADRDWKFARVWLRKRLLDAAD
jgi:RNA polymerase sigma factor (TIGR02999 family)